MDKIARSVSRGCRDLRKQHKVIRRGMQRKIFVLSINNAIFCIFLNVRKVLKVQLTAIPLFFCSRKDLHIFMNRNLYVVKEKT